ncbi:MAG: hypothetical protein ACK55I_42045, partial [bacterium]
AVIVQHRPTLDFPAQHRGDWLRCVLRRSITTPFVSAQRTAFSSRPDAYARRVIVGVHLAGRGSRYALHSGRVQRAQPSRLLDLCSTILSAPSR